MRRSVNDVHEKRSRGERDQTIAELLHLTLQEYVVLTDSMLSPSSSHPPSRSSKDEITAYVESS